MSRQVAVVAHTHWDREWYLPFETYRSRLVEMLDTLIPELESSDPGPVFLMDGQMAAVDDYIELRPEMEPAIAALVGAGRMTIGPWYVLPDEFLVSGETLVRNLELGLRRAAELGGAMPVGYLPDMFGHISQMPQLLRGFGFDQAVVWRGVPSEVNRTGFWWRAPDGSEVRAEYLPQGYGNGARLPADATLAVDLVSSFESANVELIAGDILWMHGADHQPPTPGLTSRIDDLNSAQNRYRFELRSLPGYLESAPRDGLPSWTGELRSGYRANLLMGVVSNRADIRRAAAEAERLIERVVEPVAALFDSPERWPSIQLDRAWRNLILNSAHDSVCGCSLDEVCDAVLTRYAEAHQIGSSLLEGTLQRFGQSLSSTGPTILNPSSRPRSGLVELLIPSDEPAPASCQTIDEFPGRSVVTDLSCAVLPEMVQRQLDVFRNAAGVAVSLESETVEVVLDAKAPGGSFAAAAVLSELRELAAGQPDRPAQVVTLTRDARLVLVPTPLIPGFGWSDLGAGGPAPSPVHVADLGLDNGLISVKIDPDAGSFSLNGHVGMGRLVDSGDCGDTYNYCAPDDDEVLSEVDLLDIRVLESGPLRGRIELESRIGALRVLTLLELRTDEPFLRTRHRFDNTETDHRLRVLHSIPDPTSHSEAGCAFATVSHGVHAEGGPTEAPLATFPARDFVTAGELTVCAPGCFEYELTDIDDEGRAAGIAITLVRSTGWLSHGPMSSRPLPAGPEIPLRGSQVSKEVSVEQVVAVGQPDPFRLLAAFDPLFVVAGSGEGGRPPQGSALRTAGGVISAVRLEQGDLEVRLFNPTPESVAASIADHEFDLGPWRIETISLPHDEF